MKTIVGKVVSVDIGISVKTKDGLKSYPAWRLRYTDSDDKIAEIVKPMGGLKNSPFLRKALESLAAGDEFVGEMEKNEGGFWELVSLSKGGEMPVKGNDAAPAAPSKLMTDRMAAEDKRQISIVRQSCLKAAVEMAGYGEPHTREYVLDLAEAFENWVNR